MSDNAGLDFPPNETMAKLLALENRTGYTMQQFNGQRKFWNPNWNKPIPPRGCEVFVGKIPRDLFEDELVPVFEKIGMIYELRLMMDFSGFNRGYAFVAFTCHEHAQAAIEKLDNFEIRSGQRIGVCRSVDNCRLFVGGIPKSKTQQEILQAMCEISEDVGDVIVYPGSATDEQNRGFAFVEYGTHRAAAMARRKLIPGKITIFGNEIVVDWAEPEVDTSDNTSRIKNVYVRNLKITTPEYTVFMAFNAIRPGAIEKVKKIEDRDYAFVHFLRREDALFAIQMMNGQRIDGQEVQVSLAKPPSNKHDSNASTLINNLNNKSSGVPSIRPPININHINEMAHSASVNQLPLPALQYGPPPFLPNLTDYANFLKTQPLRSLQPPPNPSAFQFKPPRPAIINPLPNMFSKPPPPLLPPPGPGGDTLNVLARLENLKKNNEMNADGSVKLNLVPANNLHHISRIRCPVLFLDELSVIFNNGCRPTYSLFLDESHETTRYVYQVNFMGKDYVPPNHLYSSNPNDARIVSAQYVLKVIEPWLKTKIENVIHQNGGGEKQSAISSTISSFPPRNSMDTNIHTQATYPGISTDGNNLSKPILWKENCNPNQFNVGQNPKNVFYKNTDSVNQSVYSGGKLMANDPAYNLSDAMWKQLRLKDVSFTNLPEKKPDFSAVKSSAASLYPTTLKTPPRSPLLGGFKSSMF